MAYTFRHGQNLSKRDRRISIQRLSISITGTGADRETWSTLATVWAHRKDTKGITENEEDRQVVAQQTVTWEIRYRADLNLTELDRVVYKSKVYDIIGIEEVDRESLYRIVTLLNKT